MLCTVEVLLIFFCLVYLSAKGFQSLSQFQYSLGSTCKKGGYPVLLQHSQPQKTVYFLCGILGRNQERLKFFVLVELVELQFTGKRVSFRFQDDPSQDSNKKELSNCVFKLLSVIAYWLWKAFHKTNIMKLVFLRANSPEWSLYMFSVKNAFREFVLKSKHFPLVCHNLFTQLCTSIVRRILILITIWA